LRNLENLTEQASTVAGLFCIHRLNIFQQKFGKATLWATVAVPLSLSMKSGEFILSSFINIVGRISTLCGIIAAIMIVVSVAITCQMIFVRYVLNWSTIWQTEFITYLMVASTLLGLPYVQKLRGHVNVDLLPLLLPHPARRALFFVVVFAAIAVIGLMLFYGVEMWWEVTRKGWTSDTVWGVRLMFPYLAIPVGLGLYLLQLIADTAAVATNREDPFGLKAHEGLTTAQREGH